MIAVITVGNDRVNGYAFRVLGGAHEGNRAGSYSAMLA